MPVDAAMELGTGYEWCDADAITEKQQTGQLAGPENGGWDFSVFGTREQPNPPWDWKERTFYELVRSGGNTGALRCKLCNKFLQGQDNLLGHRENQKHKNKVASALNEMGMASPAPRPTQAPVAPPVQHPQPSPWGQPSPGRALSQPAVHF